MVTTTDKFKFYEFFAGAGMARLGLQQKWECVWANGNDPKKISIYEHNFGPGHIDQRDVLVVADAIEKGHFAAQSSAPRFPLNVDMAWASFPCQDLSLAGWQRGMSAERSGAYWAFWKIMYALQKVGRRPPIIVIENVKGLLYGNSFRGLCESLAAFGMRFGAFLADSKCFVPQSRPRVFVIAVDDSVELSGMICTTRPPNPWFPSAVQEAFESLPDELRERWCWWQVEPVVGARLCIRDLFLENPDDVSYNTKVQTDRLLSLMAPRHLERVRAASDNDEAQIGFLYKRTRSGEQRAEIRFDGIAGCLRTAKGGSSRQTIVIAQNGQVRTRLLSRIELARLMGIDLDDEGRLPGADEKFFPESFSYNDSYSAMGDGVVVSVVAHIAKTILDKLAARCQMATQARRGALSSPALTALPNEFAERVKARAAAWSDRNRNPANMRKPD